MTTNTDSHRQPEPLDAFEREWVALLNEDQAEITGTQGAFVSGVLDRYNPQAQRPVLARIGWVPLAVAAAVLLAGAVGWGLYANLDTPTAITPIAEDESALPSDKALAQDSDNSTRPDATDLPHTPEPRLAQLSEAERRAMAQQLQLGSMISETSTAFSQPGAGLPKAISDTSDAVTLKSLTQRLTNPMPDPAEVLPPRRDRPRG